MRLTPASVSRDATRRERQLRRQIGDDVRRMRLDAGVSMARVAALVGMDRSHLSRIEAGSANSSLGILTSIGIVLGADISVRYFPGHGPRVHDRFQAPMVETLIRLLDPRWQVNLEVPVGDPSRGVIDIVFRDRSGSVVVACEVVSEIRRLEQQLRWLNEKSVVLATQLERSALGERTPPVSQLLVLRSTTATREIARHFEATLAAAYPSRSRAAYEALTTSTAPWPGPAMLWVQIRGSAVRVLKVPPPRVRVGR